MKFLIFILLFCTVVCHANIADPVLANYQANLHKLPIVKQEHFSVRMYRITGNPNYLNPVLLYIYFLSDEYRALHANLFHQNAMLNKAQHLLMANDNHTEKYQLRSKKISSYGDLFFYLYLLEATNKVFSYHLQNSSLFPQTNAVIEALKAQKDRFEAFILNDENIKIIGAQLINYVYYLSDLNIIDLKESYTKHFQKVFPDELDAHLSVLEYEAKIYGMTHFITAASHYYQSPVENKMFVWISDYLEHNIEQIIKRTENDVIAEVGICFMLLNKQDSPAVAKIKHHLTKAYNTHHRMIPTITNTVDFVYGEHRNILTVMLFNWPNELTPGPFYSDKLKLIR